MSKNINNEKLEKMLSNLSKSALDYTDKKDIKSVLSTVDLNSVSEKAEIYKKHINYHKIIPVCALSLVMVSGICLYYGHNKNGMQYATSLPEETTVSQLAAGTSDTYTETDVDYQEDFDIKDTAIVTSETKLNYQGVFGINKKDISEMEISSNNGVAVDMTYKMTDKSECTNILKAICENIIDKVDGYPQNSPIFSVDMSEYICTQDIFPYRYESPDTQTTFVPQQINIYSADNFEATLFYDESEYSYMVVNAPDMFTTYYKINHEGFNSTLEYLTNAYQLELDSSMKQDLSYTISDKSGNPITDENYEIRGISDRVVNIAFNPDLSEYNLPNGKYYAPDAYYTVCDENGNEIALSATNFKIGISEGRAIILLIAESDSDLSGYTLKCGFNKIEELTGENYTIPNPDNSADISFNLEYYFE